VLAGEFVLSAISRLIGTGLRSKAVMEVTFHKNENRAHNRLQRGDVVSLLSHFESRSTGLFGVLLWMLQREHSCVARLRSESGIGTEAREARLCGALVFSAEKIAAMIVKGFKKGNGLSLWTRFVERKHCEMRRDGVC
jgi:hypothetical protein